MKHASPAFLDLGLIYFHPELKAKWEAGDLWKKWAEEHTELFDEDDCRLANAQCKLGYHFVEWLVAINLKASLGYNSLVSKYEFQNHKRKRKIFLRYADRKVVDLVSQTREQHGPQAPDLFLYDPNGDFWMFCEVKGPGDRLRPSQREYFTRLAEAGERPVGIVKLRPLNPSQQLPPRTSSAKTRLSGSLGPEGAK